MSFILRAEMVSDVGLFRDNNEDAAHAGRRLLALADGIGGMPSGELASNIVVDALAALDATDPAPDEDALDLLRQTAETANREILRVADEDPANDGMGTTATAILLAGDQFALLHVGDSRAYLQRDGDLTQLTKDDTYVQTLVDQGLLTAEEARHHPRRSIVMQALQGFEYDPTLILQPARPGDRLMLCSDGLSDVLTDDLIRRTLAAHPDLKQCADELVRLALDGGSTDNVTVVVADILAE
jgi:serine/threonine protein phosphatase PrpC